ncbi:DNA replication initiation control protein YabA [Lacticaseibacillus brantae]|uniref:Replication initiation control protein YabA n=1 Tax=Lacticaseibacillus brantae DSM 23927 TaxID=1423727 RepID=A0A0R2AWZ8_9LACO|nr:DNA replication initiation control protein YabA [Lacticaseibacillus brantae]KRM71511.1 hypothetical protein FC34_GL001626 [Lacticaseibacillus brantae DSM 23927]
MDKKQLYDGLSQLQHELKAAAEQVAHLQQEIASVIEHDAEVEIENQHLREHLQELQKAAPDRSNGAIELSKSKLNLENLYEEGFHVCPTYYGQRRVNDEPCLFCQDIIYGER